MSLFENFIIIRSGFLQHKGSPGSGCVGIFQALHKEFQGTPTLVQLEAWDDDADHSAEFIYRLATKDRPPRVCLIGYSWGVGFGLVQLAKALEERGIEVQEAVCCDGVYHGLCRWRAFLHRTIFRQFSITIPANVRNVSWLRQEVDRPCGHDLKAAGLYTRIHPPRILGVGHCDIDNAPEFLEMAADAARRVVQ